MRAARAAPFREGIPYFGLYAAVSILYWAILAETLRRERPLILAQRPTCPRALQGPAQVAFLEGGRQLAQLLGERPRQVDVQRALPRPGFGSRSDGRFSGRITPPRAVTQARSMAFSSCRMFPGQA